MTSKSRNAKPPPFAAETHMRKKLQSILGAKHEGPSAHTHTHHPHTTPKAFKQGYCVSVGTLLVKPAKKAPHSSSSALLKQHSQRNLLQLMRAVNSFVQHKPTSAVNAYFERAEREANREFREFVSAIVRTNKSDEPDKRAPANTGTGYRKRRPP